MKIGVSDHAVLRWLERVEGFDVRAIKRRIRKAVARAVSHGAPKTRLDGVEFCLAFNPDTVVVTTVHTLHPRPHLAEPRLTAAEQAPGHWDE